MSLALLKWYLTDFPWEKGCKTHNDDSAGDGDSRQHTVGDSVRFDGQHDALIITVNSSFIWLEHNVHNDEGKCSCGDDKGEKQQFHEMENNIRYIWRSFAFGVTVKMTIGHADQEQGWLKLISPNIWEKTFWNNICPAFCRFSDITSTSKLGSENVFLEIVKLFLFPAGLQRPKSEMKTAQKESKIGA